MKIICYSIKHLTPVKRTNLQRELYGFKDISNKGKYVYQREGLLNFSNHKKIYFTGIFVDNNISKKLISVLKKHNAKFHVECVSPRKSH